MSLPVAKIGVLAAVVIVGVLREVQLSRRTKRDKQNGNGRDALSLVDGGSHSPRC